MPEKKKIGLLALAAAAVGVAVWASGGLPAGVGKRPAPEAPEPSLTVEGGRTIRLAYTLTVDGEKVDSSEERGPLEYTQGAGEIIPGLERQLAGLRSGDRRTVTVEPEEAYGRVDPEAFVAVPRERFAPDVELKAGETVFSRNEEGQVFGARIHEVGDEEVTLDLNHPLAGKTLRFDVEILEVNDAGGDGA